MPKKIFIISIILCIILTPCSFDFPKPNNLYDLTSSSAVYAAGAEAINGLEVRHICATNLTRPLTDSMGHLRTQTLTVDKSPYYFTGAVSLARNNVLTIEPGVVIKVSDEYFYEWYMYPVTFSISGKIIARGTEANPIVFTSIYDDSYCGDSNGDGAATAPKPGSWGGWQILSGDNIFDHVIMKYGGDYKRGLMVFYANTGNQITNSVFENNLRGMDFRVASSSNPAIVEHNIFFNNTGGVMAFYKTANPVIRYNDIYNNKGGIVVSDYATPLINYNNIYNNSGYGAAVNQYYSLTQPVNAQFNWWGDDSGPYHPTLNPQGKGDKVSDNILFDPWIGKEEKKDPVIIVPGIMGSWYSDEDGWQLDPILNTYDNLWEAFKLAGYEENKTLFAFPYQWRNSNVISADYLKNKINEVKSICECEKVDIVAHSMGGLVARYYVESDDYANDIDQIVFLGVPHKGAPEAYLKWEGAEGFVSYKEKIAKIYFSIEAHLLGYDSLFKYIQNKVKSVEQLLPVYSYLQDIGSVKLREYNQNLYPNNYPYNSFLESLNSEENLNRFSSSGVKVFNIVGNSGDNTIGVINVSSGEQYYPMWEHGYMEGIIYIFGDNTVPHMSSSLFPTTAINNTKHNQIPTNAQKQIIEYLTGQMPVIEINDTPEPKEILAVAIHSPADFAIISPSGKRLGKDFLSDTSINQIDFAFYTGFEDEPEFAVIINPEQGDYEVELQGTGTGEYKLELGYIDEEKEITKEFAGNIQTGEGHNFNFTYNAEGEDPVSELKPDDNIPPEITINNPRENEQYLHSENLVIDYTATDDFSGVANTVINIDNQILSTTTIDLFYYDLGEHVLNITAVDNAGNSASAEVKFEIITNIASTIRDIERIYDLGWISKKYVKQILIAELEVLRKRLDIFSKQKDNIEQLKQKLLNNSKIKEKHKQKLLDEFDKRLQKLNQQEDEFIEKSLNLLVKTLDKFLRKAVISQQGYDIIISDINYLRNNLK